MESSTVLPASFSPSDVKMEMGGMRRNSTLICTPLVAESVDQMVIDMHKAKEGGADLVEIRLDVLKSFNPRQDLEILIRKCPLPTLFTYRPKWEGGQYDGDENKRLDALRLAMELGADYVDVELKVAHEFNNSIYGRKPEKFKLIVSSHNYQNTPSVEDLGNLVARIQATGADIVKIATTALDITDVARIFRITVHSHVPVIGLAMGERGLISRILCSQSFITMADLKTSATHTPSTPTAIHRCAHLCICCIHNQEFHKLWHASFVGVGVIANSITDCSASFHFYLSFFFFSMITRPL